MVNKPKIWYNIMNATPVKEHITYFSSGSRQNNLHDH